MGEVILHLQHDSRKAGETGEQRFECCEGWQVVKRPFADKFFKADEKLGPMKSFC